MRTTCIRLYNILIRNVVSMVNRHTCSVMCVGVYTVYAHTKTVFVGISPTHCPAVIAKYSRWNLLCDIFLLFLHHNNTSRILWLLSRVCVCAHKNIPCSCLLSSIYLDVAHFCCVLRVVRAVRQHRGKYFDTVQKYLPVVLFLYLTWISDCNPIHKQRSRSFRIFVVCPL